MKRLTKLFARLYPASWRERYADEFDALLEEVNPGWRTSLDILKGAVGMQVKTFGVAKLIAGACMAGLLASLALLVAMPMAGLTVGLFAGVLLALVQHFGSAISLLRRFGVTVTIGGLTGLLIGLCAWLVIPKQFQSIALIAVTSPKLHDGLFRRSSAIKKPRG